MESGVRYRTNRWSDSIDRVEIERETEHFVILKSKTFRGKNNREAKDSGYHAFHKTWADAHDFLVKRAQARIDAARTSLRRAEEEHKKLIAMVCPQ